MIFLRLFLEFFKIGLFSVGGGLATLPFLYELSEKTSWFTVNDLSNMVAVSESTPGPIGVNMATYVGYTVGDSAGGLPFAILGSVIASLGLIAPSIIIILIIAGFLKKFSENKFVKAAFYGIRPASVGLIASALLLLARTVFFTFPDTFANFNFATFFKLPEIIMGIAFFILIYKFKKVHPIVFITVGALLGIIFAL